MKDRASGRLVAVVTALLMIGALGGPGRAGAATIEQLQAIDAMLTQKDWGRLWAYVNENPELTVGTDPLAAELRRFVVSMNTETMDAYAQTPFVAGRAPGTY